MIYLDNAATSFPKPPQVIKGMQEFMENLCANPGRSGHFMSKESMKKVIEAREKIAKLFNIEKPLNVAFTKNASEGLNIAITSIVKENDHVITSFMEHNSVIRPLFYLQKNIGVSLTFDGDEYGRLNTAILHKNLRKNTKAVICTLSSNITGTLNNIKEIGKFCRERGIIFILDASQGAGCVPVDVHTMNIDAMAFSGHKSMLGPQGTGAVYIRPNIQVKPLIHGGTGSNSENPFMPQCFPDILEAGTLNTPGIVGLSAGVSYILDRGIDSIKTEKMHKNKLLHDGISQIKNVKIYSREIMEENSGICSFNIDFMDSGEVAEILDEKFSIASRGGLHCAPFAHEFFKTTETGILRLSPGVFTTEKEIEETIEAVEKIAGGN